MRLWAIIPARGGSKGIPNKNLAVVGGLPLIAHSILSAQECASVERVIVSTDSAAIANEAQRHGADVVRRPAELSTDQAPTEPALLHVLETARAEGKFLPDFVVLLQPTSPHRIPGTLDRCLKTLSSARADSLLTVCENHAFFWKADGSSAAALYDFKNRPRRQDIATKDRWYRENGSVYITQTDLLLKQKNRLGGKIALHILSEAESVEIDTPLELLIVDRIMRAAMPKALDKIRALVMDADGVLTDGGMYYSSKGENLKKFNTRDGHGIGLLHAAGLKTAIITGENSASVSMRAKKLGINEVCLGIKKKGPALSELAQKLSVSLTEIAYIGDDLNDLDALALAGFSACPSDAAAEVRAAVDHVCKRAGGDGAVREVCDMLLSARK